MDCTRTNFSTPIALHAHDVTPWIIAKQFIRRRVASLMTHHAPRRAHWYLIVCALVLTFSHASFAQSPVPAQFMFGGDLSLNINFYSAATPSQDSGLMNDMQRDFWSSMQGTSFLGSVVANFPTSQNNGVELRATLEDVKLDKSDIVVIPCNFYNPAGQKIGSGPATTDQSEAISITYLTFGASFYQLQGHAFGSFGSAIGPALANAYTWNSRIITPDSCYYNYFQNSRSHISHIENDDMANINFRIPINIRIGLLIPFAGKVFLAPSIGVNWGVYPIDENGGTVTSIQPAMGIRYLP